VKVIVRQGGVIRHITHPHAEVVIARKNELFRSDPNYNPPINPNAFPWRRKSDEAETAARNP
jgi:hypothetical protein